MASARTGHDPLVTDLGQVDVVILPHIGHTCRPGLVDAIVAPPFSDDCASRRKYPARHPAVCQPTTRSPSAISTETESDSRRTTTWVASSRGRQAENLSPSTASVTIHGAR